LFHLCFLLAALSLFTLSLRAAHRGGDRSVLVLNTFGALLLGLVVADLVLRAVDLAQSDARAVPVFSYEEARADPEAFRRWWASTQDRFRRSRAEWLAPDPKGEHPFVLRPGTWRGGHESTVQINRLGFRGPEISLEKGARYRIVILGESTTFGALVFRTDRPWPEVLQARIATDLSCSEPIEVVNAGVPAYTLANNLKRLESQIVSLRPDLIVSYHGYNGFRFVLPELPSTLVSRAPTVPERPSLLIGRVERSLRLAWFRRRYAPANDLRAAVPTGDPMASQYADLYRVLIQTSLSHDVRPVLSTFNMAVNADTPEDVVRFYEETFPDVRARVVANALHNRIVEELGASAGVTAIDTSAGLDGAYRDAYIDLVHFTQRGRDRLADHVMRGIRPILATDPRLNCRPRTSRDARHAAGDK
jgi:lysophospholipase L1-like esterase